MTTHSIKTFINDGSEKNVQNVISKLKFISKIKEGEKVDISSMKMLDANSWYNSVYRTFINKEESRENTLEFINNIIHESFELSYTYLSKNEYFFQKLGNCIIESLLECKLGLQNLKKTYKEDRMFVSKIETLIKTIDNRISDLYREFSIN